MIMTIFIFLAVVIVMGIGLLGYEAIISRDYPIVFGTLFVFTLLGLVTQLIADVIYMLVDPRIDFSERGV